MKYVSAVAGKVARGAMGWTAAGFSLTAVGVLSGMFSVAHAADLAPTPTPTPTPTLPTEQLYVGYYQEDPIDNPEDPTIGALYLNLPPNGGNFSGKMFFTYVGCQTSNVGTITGTMSGEQLHGSWTGVTDGTPQQGDFSGRRVTARDAYAGTYNVAGGKQHIVVPDCIEYFVASKGKFELFAAGVAEPAGFAISLRDTRVSWIAPSGAIMTLVSVLDPELARTGRGNATLWQTLVMGHQQTANLGGVKLMKGHHYLATVGVVDHSFQRISFGSIEFVAP